MDIKPIQVEYLFTIRSHSMRALAEHKDDGRLISYFFDDKLVMQKTIVDGTLLSDDDYIRVLVEEYCKSNTGVFADIFQHHSDQVFLVSKTLDVVIENYGIDITAHVKIAKDVYEFELSANGGTDRLAGSFRSGSFSEGLEKLRLFTYTMESMNAELTTHIDELSEDRVEQVIQWL